MANEIAPLRILVVDDDALSREVLTLLLEHVGYTVDAADSGDAAITRLRTVPGPRPDVVLADIQMPGTFGKALAHKLRDLCGSATSLLAMSGSVPRDEEIQEFDRFLLKPFTIDELTAAIEATDNVAQPPATAIHQGLTILDEAIYEQLAASMRSERLQQLYTLSLRDVQDRIAHMRRIASNKEDAASDDTAYRQEAHKIKGGCGMVGAVELQTLAASMETEGIDANHVASLDKLTVACERLHRILMERWPRIK